MSRAFNLTAEINLRGPSNIATVVANMRRQLGTVNANVNINVNPAAIRNSTQLNSALQGLNTTLGQTGTNALAAANAINSFAQAMQRFNAGNLVQGLNNANTAAQNLNNNARNLGRGIGAARTEMEEFGRQSALAVRRFTALGIVTGVIYGITNAAKEGVRSFVEFDKEFVKLQQVTGDSANGLKGLASTLTKLSTGLGVSSGQLATVSSTLAQAGLSARDTERALKALALSSLAPSFDDMNKTVEGSIALMRQFSIGAVDLDKALGSINAVAAKFAVEASDIIAAIQRTGGVFATASRGVSEGTQALNEFVAVFTSVRATTRESAETIATGLRTIFTRIQRADTIEALKEFGVTLTDLDGKFVGAYKAVELLSRGLNSIDPRDLKFSQIVEELGGFRQIGKVIPLIQQFTTAQQALAVAQQGQGTLAEDAVTAQKSLANQTAKVKEEFLALFREIGGTDTFQAMAKGALSLASALIQIADSAKEVLPILSVMMAVRGTSALSQYAVGFAGGLRGGRRYASGGFVPGSGDGDTVPAMLTPGEFVIRKKAVQAIGVDKLHSMNRYAGGGVVQKFAGGGQALIDHLKTDKRVGAAVLEEGPAKFPKFSINKKSLEKATKIELDSSKLPSLNNIQAIQEGLTPKTHKIFDQALDQGILRGVNYATKLIGQNLGISTSKINKDNATSFLKGINSGTRGNLFEDVLLSLKEAPGPFNTRKSTQFFDFPTGLPSVLKNDYQSLPSQWVDAKASFRAASRQGSNVESKTFKQLKTEILNHSDQYKASEQEIKIIDKKTRKPRQSFNDKVLSALSQYRGEASSERIQERLSTLGLRTSGEQKDIQKMLKEGTLASRGVARKSQLEFLGVSDQRRNAGGSIFTQKFANGGIPQAPLIDDIKNGSGTVMPRPSAAITALIKAGGGAIDIDRTLKRTVGDQAYGRAKTSGEQSAVLAKYFRDPETRLRDVVSAPLTSFGKELKAAIQSRKIQPQRLSIISKSQRVPGVAEYLSQLFSIPTNNIMFTQGLSKQPGLDALRKKGPRAIRVGKFADGGQIIQRGALKYKLEDILTSGLTLEQFMAKIPVPGKNMGDQWKIGGVGPDSIPMPKFLKPYIPTSAVQDQWEKAQADRQEKIADSLHKQGRTMRDYEGMTQDQKTWRKNRGYGYSLGGFIKFARGGKADKTISNQLKNERIIVDENKVMEARQAPFDIQQVKAGFSSMLSRDQLFAQMANFSKIIGVPDQALTSVLPRVIDFDFPKGSIMARTPGHAASFDKTGAGNFGPMPGEDKSGRGAISFRTDGVNIMSSKNKTLYHELTHQLLNSLRTKEAQSFDVYKRTVARLFNGNNNRVADAIDSLPGTHYTSADIAYGRRFKISALDNILRQALSGQQVDKLDKQQYTDMIEAKTKGESARIAKQFKPINPSINNVLRIKRDQASIDNLEDLGKEEFLTTLVENIPALDSRMMRILNGVLSRTMGAAGIQRQKFADGGSSQDTVPALLTPGEFVINKNAASRIGLSRLNQLNHADKLHGFNRGGPVGHFAAGGSVQSFAFGGSVVNGILGMFSRLQPVLNSFIESIRRATAGVARVPAGGGWLGGSMPGVPATGTNPNRDPDRNTNNRFQNSLLGVSFLLPMITDMMQNAEPASANQASSNAMNQGIANSAGIGLSIAGMMPGPLGILGGVATGAIGVAKAFADAENAARDFNIKDASSKLDDSIEKVNKSLTKFGENTGDAAAKLAATNDVLASIANADKLNNANKETRRGVFNLGDSEAGSFERGEILQRNGIMDYLKTTSLFGGDNAKYSQALSFQKYIPELSKQAAKGYAGSADATTKLLETRFKSGETVASMEASNPDEFKKLTESLALADASVQQQIMSIQNLVGINQVEKTRRINNITSIYAEAKAREIQTRSLREKAIEDLNKAANRLSFSLERMFQNMEQSINKTSYDLQALGDSAEQSSLSLSGQGKIGNVSLKAINTLQNPRAYSNAEVGGATNLASSAFGFQAANMAGIIKFGNNIENVIMSTINKFGAAKGEVNNEAVGAKIESAVSQSLRDLNLPPELADKLSGQVRAALKELRQNGEDKADFSQLMEKIPGLARVIDSAKRAQEVAIKALEQWQAGLSSYAASFNSIMESQIDSNNKLRRANSLLIEGELELAKVFGGSTNLKTLQRNFNLNTQAMTGGAKSPQDIGQNIKDLEAQRRAQQAASDTAANRGPAGMNEFKLMTSRLKDTNMAIRENYDALKHLSENTDMASAAMNKISAIQQKQQAGTNILERLVTSTPEELHDLNGSLIRLSNNMAGRLNASTPEQRKESLDVFNMIAPLLGDKQGAMKANVLEAMLRESGVNQLPPMFQQVVDSLRNPEADPEMAEAIRIYRESLNVQRDALRELTKLNSLMSANTAEKAALSLKTALTGAKLSFESQTLSDIKEGINKLVALGGGKPADGKATGGVVYASAGQSIFQPKGTDTVPAMLTPGEFVVNKSAAQQNMPLLKAINNGMSAGGKVGYYADGGLVYIGGQKNTGEPWGGLSNRMGIDDTKLETMSSKKYPLLYDEVVNNPDSISLQSLKSVKGSFYASHKAGAMSTNSYAFGEKPSGADFDSIPVLGSLMSKMKIGDNSSISINPPTRTEPIKDIPTADFYTDKEGYLKKDFFEKYKTAYSVLFNKFFRDNITKDKNILSIKGKKINISPPELRDVDIKPNISTNSNSVLLDNLSTQNGNYYGLFDTDAQPTQGLDLKFPYWLGQHTVLSKYRVQAGVDKWADFDTVGDFLGNYQRGVDVAQHGQSWDTTENIDQQNKIIIPSIDKYISYRDRLISAVGDIDKEKEILTPKTEAKLKLTSAVKRLINKTSFQETFEPKDMNSDNVITIYNLADQWDQLNFNSPEESHAGQKNAKGDWIELALRNYKNNKLISQTKLPWSTAGFDDKELIGAKEEFTNANSKIKAESAEYNRNGLVFTYSKIKGPLYNESSKSFRNKDIEFSAIPLNGDNAQTNPFAEARNDKLAAIVDSVNDADIHSYVDQLLKSYDPAKGGFTSKKNYLKANIIGDYDDMTKNNSYSYSTSIKTWLATKFQKAQSARDQQKKNEELADQSKKAPGSQAIFNAENIKTNLNRQDSINSILANTLFSGSTISAIRSANFSLYKFNNIKQLPQYAADLLRLKTAFGKKIRSRKDINGNIITNPNQSKAWGMIGSVGSALSSIASGDISRLINSGLFESFVSFGTRGQMVNSVIRKIKNYASILASSGVGYSDVLTKAGVDIGSNKEIEDIYNDKKLLPIQQATIDANNNVSLKNANAQDTPKTYLDLGKQILNPLSIFPPQSRSTLFDKLLNIIGPNVNYLSALQQMQSWFKNQDSYIDPSFDSLKNPQKDLITTYLQDQKNYTRSSRDLTMLTHDELGKLPDYKYIQSMKAQRTLFAEEQKAAAGVAGKSTGGVVYASTGKLINFQPKGTDTVPAMLTPGEFVINKAATQANLPLLRSINDGGKAYNKGGSVYLQTGGKVPDISKITTKLGEMSSSGYPQEILDRMDQAKTKQEEKREIERKQYEDLNTQKEITRQADLARVRKKNETAGAARDDATQKRLTQLKARENFIIQLKEAQKSFLMSSMQRERETLEYTGLSLPELEKINPIISAERQFRSQDGKTSIIAGDQIPAFLQHIQQLGAMVQTPLENMYQIPIPPVEHFNKGGVVYASSGKRVPSDGDTIPAMLTPGEFVVNKNSASSNMSLLQNINSGHYSSGGVVYAASGRRINPRYDQIMQDRRDAYDQMMQTRRENYRSRSQPISNPIQSTTSPSQPVASSTNTATANNPGINSGDFQKFLDGFANNIKTFGSYIDKLSTIKPIPETINMKGQHEVNVRITGAAAFEGLKQDFMNMLETEIGKEMENIWRQSVGLYGRPSNEKTRPKNGK